MVRATIVPKGLSDRPALVIQDKISLIKSEMLKKIVKQTKY